MPRRFTDHDLALFRRKNGEPNLPIPPKPRKKPNNEESRHQQSLINWWHVSHAEFGVPECCLFAVGNGGHRSPITGAIMKREGVRRGTSDLILMVKRGQYGALAIEMKAANGVCSLEQRQFLKAMMDQGYCAQVCYSRDEAVSTITAYLAYT